MQWLWSTVIQKELNELKDRFNNHIVRRDRSKLIPSGVATNVVFSLHEQYSGEDCLQPVDPGIIRRLMEELGGEELIQFVSPAYASKAQAVFNTLHIQNLALQNVWHVFQAMLPLMTES